jgi:hypothetical protein
LELQVQIEGLKVQSGPEARERFKCAHLRSEGKDAAALKVEQRLDTDTVPSKEKLVLSLIPDGESKHAPEALQARLTPFLVSVDDHLRIGSGPKAMPLTYEFIPECKEIVDLAVEGNTKDPVIRGEWLHPADGIDDGQTSVQQRDRPELAESLAVRPSRL